VLSSRALDGHQMYSGGSVVGKASTIGSVAHPSPNFDRGGGSKSAKFGKVVNITRESLNFEPPAFENAARYLNSETKLLV